MNGYLHPAFVMLMLVGATALVGCKSEATDQPTAPAADAAPDPLAELSAADRAAVLAQRICPVTEEPLGSMGTPIAVEVEGRTVYICCEHCRESLEADPAKYLAMLDGTAADAGEAAESEGDAAADEADEPAAEGETTDEAAGDAAEGDESEGDESEGDAAESADSATTG